MACGQPVGNATIHVDGRRTNLKVTHKSIPTTRTHPATTAPSVRITPMLPTFRTQFLPRQFLFFHLLPTACTHFPPSLLKQL